MILRATSRSLLLASTGLASSFLFACPTAHARPLHRDPYTLQEHVPFENRATFQKFFRSPPGSTLSGTLLRQSQATTTWLLYPGACADRANGTWAPRTSPIADSLNSYELGTTGPYTLEDRSLKERLWHVVDEAVPANQRPEILEGSRSLWCGKYDPNWYAPVGYPNQTYQILYIDTGVHAADYTLSFLHNFSAELEYDFIYLVGGGDDAPDPIGNNRTVLDEVIHGESVGNMRSLVQWTGSIQTGSNSDTRGGTVFLQGTQFILPVTVSSSFLVEAQHRALYIVFISDCVFSSEDGLWPEGQGFILDLLETSDHGIIYDNQPSAGGIDAFGGEVLLGTPAVPVISARRPNGVGEYWQITAGASLPTADLCSPQKQQSSDLMFLGADPTTLMTVPGAFTSIVGCTFPIPPGTASVLAMWNMYLDAPTGSNTGASTEYRTFKDGAWSTWSLSVGRGGSLKAWVADGMELVAAAQADSVQIRYTLTGFPGASGTLFGVLYDDFRLQVVTGTPAPVFEIDPLSVPQSNFIDGTMLGTNCTTIPCWPGAQGTESGILGGGDHHKCHSVPQAYPQIGIPEERDGHQLAQGIRPRRDRAYERLVQSRVRHPSDDLPALRSGQQDMEPLRLHGAQRRSHRTLTDRHHPAPERVRGLLATSG